MRDGNSTVRRGVHVSPFNRHRVKSGRRVWLKRHSTYGSQIISGGSPKKR